MRLVNDNKLLKIKSGLLLMMFLFFTISDAQHFPLSDQSNTGNWELNTEISDEFNDGFLDGTRWQIQGENGIYKSNFIGRAPSQFSTQNAIVEDNKLKILTKWDPGFPFSDITENGVAYENITTAAVISRKKFHYGYMEIRSKAAKAEVTSSFWTTGFQSELDMFEMFGDTDPGEASINWRKRLKFNLISWNPNNPYYSYNGNGPAHTRNIQVEHNTAEDFNVYGFEWTSEYIKIYINGILHPEGTVLRSELGEDRWTTNVPYWIWFDSETFPWLGIPERLDLLTPAKYEIDYVRIWENKNLLSSDFFGFESSINIDGIEQNWFIPNNSSNFISKTSEKSYRWDTSLKFEHNGLLPNNAVAFSPFKSVNLEARNYNLSFKLWLEPNSSIKNLQIVLDDPSSILNFDLSGLEKSKWVTMAQDFSNITNSGDNARLRVRIRPVDVSNGLSTLYLDDLLIKLSEAPLSVDDVNLNDIKFKLFPNPINRKLQSYATVSAPDVESIIIYSINGKKIIELKKESEPFNFQIDNLESGVYFISVLSKTNLQTKKIIII